VPEFVVVGAGHNGLVAACYLARAGREVLVLEALDRPGGGARTEETIPGYRFDLHSVAHNIINMTDIPDELDLAGAGLVYQPMDPFSVAVHEDGRRVRFFRSIEATVDSIAETSPAEAVSYRAFMDKAVPIIRAVMPAVRGEVSVRELPGRAVNLARALRQRPLATVRDVLGPYDSLLRRWLDSDLAWARSPPSPPTRAWDRGCREAPCSPSGRPPTTCSVSGTGGAGPRRSPTRSCSGSARTAVSCAARAPVGRIEAPAGRVRAVVVEGSERIAAGAVVTAIDPTVALLELLDPPLGGRDRADLAAVRRGNVVQALVHVATDRLPAYPHARPGDWNGLQSFVDSLSDLTSGWSRAEAGLLSRPLPLYAFTGSALDDTLAPAGHHTAYLACPAAPAEIEGGWPARRDEFVEACLDVVESRAPGFRDSIRGIAPHTPDRMQTRERWRGAHPMHLDIALDQLGPFRPTRRLGSHRTPIAGLYVSGAGTNPTGGVAGTPGRMAARAILEDRP
jgi:phytoene dehydrogenase-like protein